MIRRYLIGILALLNVGVVSLAKAETVLPPDITVAADGTGNFKTVQEALDSIPGDNKQRMIVLIKDGVYPGQVRVASPFVTLRGQSRKGTRLEFGKGAAAVLNVNANDLVLENLSIINTVGVVGPHEIAISGRQCDRTVIIDCDILSEGADTIALWQNDGRYYYARCNIRGSVDFVCPHGWCYMTDCNLYECKDTAAMWHDGQKAKEMKFVIRDCKFDGVEGWSLARHHHDAHFYFLDCTFAKSMVDKAPYRVIYPLNGTPATQADIDRNKSLDPSNIWGERAYYFNSHRTGGDYAWLKDNLDQAPGSPKSADITAKWTFGRTWDPEDKEGPKVTTAKWEDGKLRIQFSENVTVKGKPSIKTSGEPATYESGSGSDTLVFASANRIQAALIDLNGGAIIATQASATIRPANLTVLGKSD